ncbi:hypothetical protein DAPPUDRAFT_317478 [Daphnia pulex]|uniref:Tc1-like transposase DDE domain-containing protein n=1 Tax=Daphnia pulex TaxID=6669 RepID=E9GG29_DAPPU|nr:hypothetical protein DAPPUDRAFT_317478 [Daphnia pulex]|eukprot:EFX81569.1 hypothetical protein DAPPUDRAFT_317478 [Daphnia pulex]
MAEFIPKLDIETMMRRKQFAQKYLRSEEILIHPSFVDEQRFCFRSNGEITLHSGSHGKNVKDTVAVWSCIGVDHSRNAIKKLDSRLDTSQYKELLSLHVVPYCKERKLVHDHFPVHTAKSVRDFIPLNGVQVIEKWQNKSGDLVPLEIIWKEMAKKLSGILDFTTCPLRLKTSLCLKLFHVTDKDMS